MNRMVIEGGCSEGGRIRWSGEDGLGFIPFPRRAPPQIIWVWLSTFVYTISYIKGVMPDDPHHPTKARHQKQDLNRDNCLWVAEASTSKQVQVQSVLSHVSIIQIIIKYALLQRGLDKSTSRDACQGYT